MPSRKQQKMLDKAIANLLKYSQQGDWAEQQSDFFETVLMDTAEQLGISLEELEEALNASGLMNMAFGYLFELFAIADGKEDELSLINDYLKRRGWRESDYGQRYLKALYQFSMFILTVTTPVLFWHRR